MQPVVFATEFVWSEFSSQLRRFILRQVRDEALADDILQEVFVKIHLNVHTLQASDKLQSWLYQIARNTVADHYRRNKPADPINENLPMMFDGEDESEMACDTRACVMAVLLGLPDTYRVPLALDTQGISQQKIADSLGLSLSGAKSRVQRGRTLMRQTLMDICKFEFDRRGNILGCGA